MARRNSSHDSLPHLKRREDLGGGLFAAVRECCELAARALAKHSDEGVHGVRQAFKRARAVLRLAEDAGAAPAKSLRREIARDARKFSALRDATVAARTAEKLAGDLADDAQAAARELARKKARQPNAAWWSARRAEFARIRHRLKRLGKSELAPHELEASLRCSVKRVDRQAKRACGDHDRETAHEWRKKVVVLREQILVARTLLGAETDELHDGLKRLAHRLGEATDCRVFIAAVEKHRSPARFGDAPSKLIAVAQKKQKRALKRARKCWKKVRRMLRAGFSVA